MNTTVTSPAVDGAIPQSLAAMLSHALSSQPDQPEWLRQLHQQGQQQLQHYGLPAEGSENWRYSSLRPLLKRTFTRASQQQISVDEVKALAGIETTDYRMVFIDGIYQAGLSLVPTELQIKNISGALQDPGLAADLQNITGADDAGFSYLNASAFNDGLYIKLSAGQKAEAALHFIQITSGNTLSHPRHVIRLGEGARLTLIEHILNLPTVPGSSMLNSHTRLILEAGAQLDWIRSQRLSGKAILVDTVACLLAENARLHCTHVDTGGLWARHDFSVALAGQQAFVEVDGVVLVRGRQHCDFHTMIDHQVENGTSRENFKCIADGRGRGIYNGKILVQVGADGTDSAQKSANLLLSPHAEIDTKPDLEILADDVIASHGATVGELDEDALFYMRSRGIGETLGRQLLMRAFCQEVVDLVAVEDGRSILATQLDRSFETMELS